jgi:SAM-dependent methyltransferase
MDNVLDLRPRSRTSVGDAEAWTAHWSDDHQQSVSQRFFSVYRKAVFARSVSWFVNRYFPEQGVFLEAGSGTSETSMRIDTRAGARTLIALDLIPGVLAKCHPIMDVRISGDIFKLPLRQASVDGIWNVGVMEHFTAPQIDAILREFQRVLRPGGRLILLWPGTDSIPQRILRVAEILINLRPRQERFRFHPSEISQLHSVAEGRGILTRHGFEMVGADPGPRSLMAFKILVGAKPVARSSNG